MIGAAALRRVLAATACLVLVLVGGCGGGGGGVSNTLTGRVVDGAASQPLAGVRVALGESSAFTVADGTFRLTDVGIGSGTLSAQLAGYETGFVPVTIVAGSNTLTDDVLLAPETGNPPEGPPRTIQGTIALAGQSDSAGVEVLLIAGGSTVDTFTTDADGTYHFWVPVDTYTVRASKSGFASQETVVVVTDLSAVVTADFTLLALP